MKVKLGLVIVEYLVLVAAGAWAQPGRGPGGKGGGMHYGTMWDANGVPVWAGRPWR